MEGEEGQETRIQQRTQHAAMAAARPDWHFGKGAIASRPHSRGRRIRSMSLMTCDLRTRDFGWTLCDLPGRCSASCCPCAPARAPPTAAPHLPQHCSCINWLRGGVVVNAALGGGDWPRCEEGARWRTRLMSGTLTVLSTRRPHPALSGHVACWGLLRVVSRAPCLKLECAGGRRSERQAATSIPGR